MGSVESTGMFIPAGIDESQSGSSVQLELIILFFHT